MPWRDVPALTSLDGYGRPDSFAEARDATAAHREDLTMSTDNVEDGGDISSGFGESTVTGEVSDERAAQMLRGRRTPKEASGEPGPEAVPADEQDSPA